MLQSYEICVGPTVVHREICNYILQVQMQMFTCQAKYADFITWTPQQSAIFRVARDEDFTVKSLDTISRFWAAHIHPRLTGTSSTTMDQEEV